MVLQSDLRSAERMTARLRKESGQPDKEIWRVQVLDVDLANITKRGGLTVWFEIYRLVDDELVIAQWGIQGAHEPTSRASRVPLHTSARAALFHVEQMLEGTADELAKGIHRSRHKTTESGRVIDPLAGTRPPSRRNRHVRPDDETRIRRVVEAYREAFELGRQAPTMAAAKAANVSRSTAARDLAKAREREWLGPALPNRDGEARPPGQKRRR